MERQLREARVLVRERVGLLQPPGGPVLPHVQDGRRLNASWDWIGCSLSGPAVVLLKTTVGRRFAKQKFFSAIAAGFFPSLESDPLHCSGRHSQSIHAALIPGRLAISHHAGSRCCRRRAAQVHLRRDYANFRRTAGWRLVPTITLESMRPRQRHISVIDATSPLFPKHEIGFLTGAALQRLSKP